MSEDILTSCDGKNGLFQCKPRRYCHRVRRGFRLQCELRPGIKRWSGMKKLASEHTAALVAGLYSQKHCGEPDAGPYCIARPQGLSIVSEATGNILAILVGGYKSILAIESPGGSDDRQWLIFWLILSIVFFVENHLARVLLSQLPLYFEIKLLCLTWLIWWEGADLCYRRLKRFFRGRGWIIPVEGTAAQEELIRMQALMGEKLLAEVQRLLSLSKTDSSTVNPSTRASTLMGVTTARDWQQDYDEETSSEADAMKELLGLSSFLLSAEGATLLANAAVDRISKENVGVLLEKAADCASFQPRYLNIALDGSITGPQGEVPSMDPNGLADPYVVFRLVPPPGGGAPYPTSGIKSSICYKTCHPRWNHERIEMTIRGGEQDRSGYYRSYSLAFATQLHMSVHDADVGPWYLMYLLFKIVSPICCVALWALPKLPKSMIPQWWIETNQQTVSLLVLGTATVGFLVSYSMAVLLRSDDELIGESFIPLGILMDQGSHTLLLTLQQPLSERAKTKQNSVGGYGIIRVKLSLSEN